MLRFDLIFLHSYKSLWVRPRSCPTILRYGSYTCEYFKISQHQPSYLLPKPHSLEWQREWNFGGLMWEGEARRRNITKQVRPEEKVGPASHQPQPNTLIRALKLKSRKRITQGAQGANTPRRTVVKLLRPEDWRPRKEFETCK